MVKVRCVHSLDCLISGAVARPLDKHESKVAGFHSCSCYHREASTSLPFSTCYKLSHKAASLAAYLDAFVKQRTFIVGAIDNGSCDRLPVGLLYDCQVVVSRGL